MKDLPYRGQNRNARAASNRHRHVLRSVETVRNVNLRFGLSVERARANVPRDADDSPRRRAETQAHREPYSLANRVLRRKEFTGETLVDHRHRLGTVVVVDVETASFANRNPHRRKKAGTYGMNRCASRFTRRRLGTAGNNHVPGGVPSAERRSQTEPTSSTPGTARMRSSRLQQLVVALPRLGSVTVYCSRLHRRPPHNARPRWAMSLGPCRLHVRLVQTLGAVFLLAFPCRP